jgi:hypothetical protein
VKVKDAKEIAPPRVKIQGSVHVAPVVVTFFFVVPLSALASTSVVAAVVAGKSHAVVGP